MVVMSEDEFKANPLEAIACAEAGEVIEITRDGIVFAEIRGKRKQRGDSPEFQAASERLVEGFKTGIPGLSGPATYEERTER